MLSEGLEDIEPPHSGWASGISKWRGKYWKSGRRFGLNVHTLRWYVLIGLSLVDYTWPGCYIDIRFRSFLRYVHHPLGLWKFGVELGNFGIYWELTPHKKTEAVKNPDPQDEYEALYNTLHTPITPVPLPVLPKASLKLEELFAGYPFHL